ncbi:MAG: cytochrome c oxidase subunit I [Paracoccus sp. (in: a-proteobacteria)]|nr:cytochrome c oxidase subunit I [Paracoccus sp. (in: a-proteobacteria)]
MSIADADHHGRTDTGAKADYADTAIRLSPPGDGLSAVARHRALHAIWTPGRGIWGFLTSTNHSQLGLRFMVTAAFFFAIGGLLSMLIRAQLATPDSAFLSAEAYNQVFTMHGTIMMFLFAIPVLEGFGLYMLPKMLGTRDLAFPRLSAFGYWCYLFGGLIILGAMLMGLAPNAGWFMYTPLSSDVYTPGINSDIWLLGVTFVEISAMTMAVELTVSILMLRAPGMSLARMPIMGWYYLVTALMMVVGFPPLIAGSLMLEAERAIGLPFFDPTRGGDPILWQHLFWLFGHPEVYIIFLPAAGMLSMLIPTFSGRPLRAYNWIVAAIVLMGVVSFLIWAHHMFTVGLPQWGMHVFSIGSAIVAIPTAIQIFAWLGTMAGGRPRRSIPMLYVFGFFVIFVNGGLTGVMLAAVPFNWQVHDSYFVVAHLHYVLIGGMLFPVLAGLYYWLPSVTGRLSVHSVSVPAFWLIFAGFNGTFLLMHLTGLLGMRRRVHGYEWEDGWHWLNLLSSVSGFVLTMGFALIVLDIVLQRRLGPRFRRNPWAARTLEWAVPSPPPSYAFGAIPAFRGRADRIDVDRLAGRLAAGEGYLATPRNGWQETMAVDIITGKPDHIAILRGNSILPLLTGASISAVVLGVLLSWYWISLAALIVTAGLFILNAMTAGQDRDRGPVDAGQGLSLPVSSEAPYPISRLAMRFTLIANGTLFLSVLFGVFYLRFAAPNWPPLPEFGPRGDQMAVIGGGAIAAVAGLVLMGLQRWLNAQNRAGGDWSAAGLAAIAVQIAGALGLTWMLASGAMPDPRAHAFGASQAALVFYAAFHFGVGALFNLAAILRARAGRISPSRSAELELPRMWIDYTAAVTLISLAVVWWL